MKKNLTPRPDDPQESANGAPDRYETALVQSAFEAIWQRAGWPVVVYFRKRTTGKMRRMVCIYDPERADEAPHGFDHVKHSTLPVWDIEKGAVRCISLDAVREIKCRGERVWPERQAPRSLAEADAEMERLFGY